MAVKNLTENPYAKSIFAGSTLISLRSVASNTVVLEVSKSEADAYNPQRLIVNTATLDAIGGIIADFKETISKR